MSVQTQVPPAPARVAGAQSSRTKALLLLRLAATNPGEFYDRVRTIAECRQDRASAPASERGGTPAQLVASLSDALKADIRAIMQEPAVREHEAAVVQAQRDLAARASFGMFHNADFALARLCYAVCRALRPQVVVETGVAFGTTTSFLLRALAQNGQGKLWSVDLPPLGPHADAQVGALVAPELRSAWKLVRGSSRRVLPRVIAECGDIGMFVHDSLHTYRHMKWEFGSVWPRLRQGGVLISDDVQQNRAFEEFGAACGSSAVFTAMEEQKGCSYGAIVKVTRTA